MLCYVLAFLMAAPAFTALTPIIAQAQAPDKETPVVAQSQMLDKDIVQVAVVDFTNKTKYGGDEIGLLASDALVVELKNSLKFDVVGRKDLEDAMNKLGLRPPLSRTELLRVGAAALGGDYGQAAAMIEGEVAGISLKGEPRRATVTIAVRVVDITSGELINGAVATGKSALRIGDTTDDDRLIMEAINDAAYVAVKAMVEYILPEATVQNTIGANEALLNKGAREGIRRGMRMVVFRRGEVVGKVEVKAVTPNDATVAIIRAPKGVKPEDKVRAIFEPSESPSGGVISDVSSGRVRDSRSRGGGRSGKGNALVTLLLLFGLASFFKGGSGTESMRGQVTAQAGFSPEVYVPAGIRVRWDPSKMANGVGIVEYHIYRDNVIVATAPKGASWFDEPWNPALLTCSYQTAVNGALVARTSTFIALATAIQDQAHHQYAVSALYEVPTGRTDEDGVPIKDYAETTRAQATGLATIVKKMVAGDLILPVALQAADPTEGITFQWKARRGADSYIIQISSSPSFLQPEYTSPVVSYRADASDDEILPPYLTTDIGNALDNIPDEAPVWWRVGARYSGDSPGPIPVSSSRYLFSEASSFYKAETPPPNP